MGQIVLGPTRAYPNIPTVGDSIESHTAALNAIVEALNIAQRRTNSVLDSFVRVRELETLGLANITGSVVTDSATEESTTHHHDLTYLKLDGTNDPVTGLVNFDGGLTAANATITGTLDVSGATYVGLSSDDLSDVASIAMLDENEIVLNPWQFNADITMDNATAVNWLDIGDTPVEFLTFLEIGGAVTPDPDIASVVCLITGENATAGATTISSVIGSSTLSKTSTGVAEVSTTHAKQGTQSLKTQYTSGINFGRWDETAKNANLDLGSSDFTIEFWVYATQLAGSQYIRYDDSLTGSQRAWYLVFTLSGNMQFFTSTSGGSHTQTLSALQGVSLGSWHHIAVTRQGSTMRLFFNGALINSGTFAGTFYSGANQRLRFDNSSSLSTWWIDEFRITKGVARYTGAFTPQSTAFDTGLAAETFIVGDTAFPTLIDGSTITLDAGTVSVVADNLDLTSTTALNVTGVTFTGLSSDDLSDVASIAMLDEAETVLADWYFSAGLNFGTLIGTSVTDVSKHIDLYGGSFGIGITSGSMNFVTSSVRRMWLGAVGVIMPTGHSTRWYDAANSTYANFAQSSGVFETTFSGTTNWNISGITAIQAGTVDADFDAITATSYGGILEENLVDKTAVETISGLWTHTGGAGGTALQIQATTNWSSGTFYTPMIDFEQADGTIFARIRGYTADGVTGYLGIVNPSDSTTTAFLGPTIWLYKNTNLMGGNYLRMYDSTSSDYITFSHDGTYFNLVTVNTDAFRIAEATWITGGNQFRIYDAAGTDYGDFSHNGTSFISTFTNTSEWELTGLTQFELISGNIRTSNGYVYAGDGVNTSFINYAGLYGDRVAMYVQNTNAAGSIYLQSDTGVNIRDTAGVAHLSINTSANSLTSYLSTSISSGNYLQVFDSTNTDYARFQHDGTDFNTTFSGTVDWNITGLANGTIASDARLYLEDNRTLYRHVISNLDTVGNAQTDLHFSAQTGEDMYIGLNYTGVAGAYIDNRTTGNTALRFNGTAYYYFNSGRAEFLAGADLWIRDAGQLLIYDATDADYASFSHDGTDFNTAFTGTTAWNITGASKVKISPMVQYAQGNPDDSYSENSHFIWMWPDNSTDTTTWMKVCDVTCYAGTYSGLAMTITVRNSNSNYGASADIEESTYNAAFHRSAAVLDDQDTAVLYGFNPGATQLRIIKTATGVYELQALNTATYDSAQIEVLTHGTNGGTVTPTTTVAAGSTVGTVYSATYPPIGTSGPVSWQPYTIMSGLRILDSGLTDYADFSHDGTDFNTAFTTTTDWNITGLTKIDHDGRMVIRGAAVAGDEGSTLVVNSSNCQFTMDYTAGGADMKVWNWLNTGNAYSLRLLDDTYGAGDTVFTVSRNGTATSVFSFDTGRVDSNVDVWVRDGTTLRIFDSTDTDYAAFSHDGIDFNTAFTTTTDWNITGLTALTFDGIDFNQTSGNYSFQLGGTEIVAIKGTGTVEVHDGFTFRVLDATDTDYVQMTHDGTDFSVVGAGTGWIIHSGLSQGVLLSTGAKLRIRDTGDTDYIDMSHDGTDFNFAATNTVDVNFTGFTTDFVVGNYRFNANQTVGVGQDNYVLTYDNATGKIGLEAAASGGYLTASSSPTITGNWGFQQDTIGDFMFWRNGITGAAGIGFRNDDGVKGYVGFGDDERFVVWNNGASVIFAINNTGAISTCTGATFTGAVTIDTDGAAAQLIIGDGTSTSGDVLLQFNIDRPWSFRAQGDDANSYLLLYAENAGKNFYIGSAADIDAFIFYPDGGNLTAAGTVTANKHQGTGLSTSWGTTSGVNTGAYNTVMGVSSSATWLISGTSSGTFRGGVQLLDTGGAIRLYANTGYLEYNSSNELRLGGSNVLNNTKIGYVDTMWGWASDASTHNFQGSTVPNASASAASIATTWSNHITQWKSGAWDINGGTWMPDANWWWCGTFAHTSNTSSYNYAGQIAFQNATTPNVYFRTISGGTPGSWYKAAMTGLAEDITGTWVWGNNNPIQAKTSGGTATDMLVFNSSNQFVVGHNSYKLLLNNDGVFIKEKSSDATDIAAYGQFWVKSSTPNIPVYTDDAGGDYYLGYAEYKLIANQSTNMNTSADTAWGCINAAWYSDNATAYTLTLENSTGTNFPVGAQMTIWNEGSGTLTITEGTSTTLYLMTGSAVTDTAGGCTMGQGGYATLIRKSSTVYLIMGSGLTA